MLYFFLLKECDTFMKTQILKKHVIASANGTYSVPSIVLSALCLLISLHNGVVIHSFTHEETEAYRS